MSDATTRARDRRLRIVYFCNPDAPSATLVFRELLRAVRSVEGARVVAVCDSARREPPARWRHVSRSVAATLAKRLFDADRRPVLHPALLTDTATLARRHRIPVVVPPARDINHPDFAARLRDEIGANTAISVGCIQIFRPALLAAFDDAVNLHGGTLPRYRGLGATGWSIYRGEKRSGYSYHRMSPGIDEGPILRRGDVPIGDPPDAARIEFEKNIAAAARIADVLRDLRDGAPGHAQEGEPTYFCRADLEAIRTVEAPEQHSFAELDRRLRAFRSLWLPVGGLLREATKLERAPRRREVDFETSDGVPVVVTRVGFVPPGLHRVMERVGLAGHDPYGPAPASRGSGPPA